MGLRVATRQLLRSFMTKLTWSDDFRVGHEELDSEHRLFVDLVNIIYSGASFSWLCPKLNSLLDDVHHLAEMHFRHENAILSTISRGPLPSNVDRLPFIQAVTKADFDRHVANHAEGLKELRTIISHARDQLQGLRPYFNSDLSDWFLKHVTVYDAHLKPVFERVNRHPIGMGE